MAVFGFYPNGLYILFRGLGRYFLSADGGIQFLPEWSSHPRNLSRTMGGAWGGIFLWNWSGFRGAGGQKKPAVQERASYIQVRKG